MATILNIETSGRICSVAITKDGAVEYQLEDHEGMKHAEVLAPFVEKCMEELKRKGDKLDAIAVSIGPGSYTGLRIGLSLAKGLAFSMDLPLIGVSTLQILAVKTMFRNFNYDGTELLVPMIDARRMEVFTGVYDFALNEIETPGAKILDETSWSDILKERKVIFMGNGSEKAKSVISSSNAEWAGAYEPVARDMLALSEKHYREGRFIDRAYSVPEYLKEYQTTTPKNKLQA
ncbi:MAG: tRNA (adenosine(37)-N6)-threonylcarbamoyltransferase complex dimerization subunit type 1 TsaB [Muribaculaceae bacterium]|nr:tRNA (adenosine(37)-N6)-threonylcarbamoyltransferase complex dimerization subunit type 1 TsaB [Muribaculaceae bacterium]